MPQPATVRSTSTARSHYQSPSTVSCHTPPSWNRGFSIIYLLDGATARIPLLNPCAASHIFYSSFIRFLSIIQDHFVVLARRYIIWIHHICMWTTLMLLLGVGFGSSAIALMRAITTTKTTSNDTAIRRQLNLDKYWLNTSPLQVLSCQIVEVASGSSCTHNT